MVAVDSIPLTLQYIATGTQLQDAQGVLSLYTGTQLRNARTVAEQERVNLYRARQRLLHTQNSRNQDRGLLTLVKWSVALVISLALILVLYIRGAEFPTATGAAMAGGLLVLLYLTYFTWWSLQRLSQPDAFLHGLSGDATSATKRRAAATCT